jgi:hypothetical protein
MPLLIPHHMSCLIVLGAEDEELFCCLSSSAAAAEGGRHKWDSGLDDKSIQANYSLSKLDSE